MEKYYIKKEQLYMEEPLGKQNFIQQNLTLKGIVKKQKHFGDGCRLNPMILLVIVKK